MRLAGRYRRLSLVVVAGMLAACSDVAAPAFDSWRQPGILQLLGYDGVVPQRGPENGHNAGIRWNQPAELGVITPPDVLVAPDTVDRGMPFTVAVTTIGSNGCWRADGMSLTIGARVVELRPYDARSGADICTTVLVYLRREASVTLMEPGEWVLRVDGRRVQLGEARDTPVTAEKTILVR